MKKALVLGATGQDGSYITELLLKKGYEVYGMIRRSATGNTLNIQHLIDNPDILNKNFFICRGDLADPTSLYRIISQVQPDEIYNFADQDHVSWSYDMVGFSADVTAGAVARILEIIKQINPKIKYLQPCTSNMFGKTESNPQDENTPFNPQSPYACAKAFAYYITRYYRQNFGIFSSTAIFYNHESPRRPIEYVTRKISRSVALIARGKLDKLTLGDMSTRIDWGYSKDYVEAAWEMLQLDQPDDFVIGTGEVHSIQEFVEEAFKVVNLDPKIYVSSDPKLFRPTATSVLRANISKAKKVFGFDPKTKFKDLVRLMVENDLQSLRS